MVSITPKWHSRQNTENSQNDVQLSTSLCYGPQRSDGFFFFLVFSGPETRLCCKTCTFFSAHKRTGNEIIGQAKQGISPGPTEIELFTLLFADDLSLGSTEIELFTVC